MFRKLLLAAAAVASLAASPARARTNIDFYFPVPVQGALAVRMQHVIAGFNKSHPDIHVTAVYTGSYDDTNLKTHAAIKAGRPPALALMSANFIREYAIERAAIPLDGLITQSGTTPAKFMAEFWPALAANAMEAGHVYGVPFQNSTPLLYYSVDAFKSAGLDPNHPPATWAEWLADAKKLTVRKGGQTTRWGLMMPGTYDYLGWITSGLVMADGGQYYNHDWGGEVYYNAPSTIGALTLIDRFVNQDHVMPPGVTDANAVTSAFFAGKTAMMVLSTGSLSFVRTNMKHPYLVAFMPKAIRHAAPIGGASLIVPVGNNAARQKAAWTLVQYLVSPKVAGAWSRFTGYFAPRIAAYDLPAMKAYMAKYPDAKVALAQLRYAVPWFATYRTVPVRKALEDQVQAILAGKTTPVAAAAAAQKAADVLLRPYVDATALNLPK